MDLENVLTELFENYALYDDGGKLVYTPEIKIQILNKNTIIEIIHGESNIVVTWPTDKVLFEPGGINMMLGIAYDLILPIARENERRWKAES